MAEILDLDELLKGDNSEAEVLTFYKGTVTLYYDHRLHAYYRVDPKEGRILIPGATTVTATIDKSGPLTQWAANEACNLLRTKILPGETYTAEQLEALFNEARFNFRKISKTATDIGHMAHRWLEDRLHAQIRGEHFTAALPDNEKAVNCINSALDWMEKHQFTAKTSEIKVYSRMYDYAGTMDWDGWFTGCGDPECSSCWFIGTQRVFVVGDFKSSKALYDEYRAQLAAYQHARSEEFPELKYDGRLLLQMGKEDGKFNTMFMPHEEFEADFTGFLGALATFNWMKQLTLEKKAAKDAEKAAKLKAEEASGKKPHKPRVPKVIIPTTGYTPIPVEA